MLKDTKSKTIFQSVCKEGISEFWKIIIGLQSNNSRVLYFPEEMKSRFNTILQYPCTAIEAPMGFGKTTMLNETLGELKIKSIWQSAYDSGASEFWVNFAYAISKIDRKCGDALKRAGVPLSGISRHEAILLLESLEVDETVVLVFDDYHKVCSKDIDVFLMQWIDYMPVNLHLVIVSQKTIFKNGWEMQLKGRLNIIGLDAMLFSKTDIKKYCQLCGIKVSEKEYDEIYAYSEGWISAIYLLILGYGHHGEFVFALDIFEILKESVYVPLNDELKAFLKMMCFLDTIDLKQAEFIWQKGNAKELIGQLLSNKAFVIKKPSSQTYSIHNLFKACIRETVETNEKANAMLVLQRMGQWAIQNEDYVSAQHHFYKAHDFKGLLTAFIADRGRSVSRTQKNVAIKVYEECSDETLANQPMAILIYAMIMLNVFGDKHSYEKACERFLRVLDKNESLTEEKMEQLRGEYALVESMGIHSDISKMSECNIKAAKLLKEPVLCASTFNEWVAGSLSIFALFHREKGCVEKMIALLGQSELPYSVLGPAFGKGSASVMEAEWNYLKGDFENAEIATYEVISTVPAYQQSDLDICAYTVIVRLALIKGDYTYVEDLLKNLRQRVVSEPTLSRRNALALCEAYLMVELKQGNQIPPWLSEGRYAQEVNYIVLPLANTIYGKYLLQRKKAIEFLGLTNQFLETASLFSNVLCQIYTWIQVAAANNMLFRDQGAKDALKTAMDLAMHDGLIMPFVENAELVLRILQELQKECCYERFIKEVLQNYKIYSDSIDQMQEQHFHTSSYTLTIREKEVAQLVINGYNNNKIASELYISPNTVKRELKSIFKKTGIKSRTQLSQTMIKESA